jgi:ferredoxin
MDAAPEIFEVRDDGMLYILNDAPDESERLKVEEALRLCPTQSIWIVD